MKLLFEFDEDYHAGQQHAIDKAKAEFAESKGYTVVRKRKCAPNSVFSVDLIADDIKRLSQIA